MLTEFSKALPPGDIYKGLSEGKIVSIAVSQFTGLWFSPEFALLSV